MSLTFQLKDNELAFTSLILSKTTQVINRHINSVLDRMIADVRKIVVGAIETSPEVISMRGGDLQGDLGFSSPDYFIRNLLGALEESVNFIFQPFYPKGKTIQGKLVFHILSNDYNKILTESWASYDSNGYTIDWLKWLLTEGSNIVISNYQVIPDYRGVGRSRISIMGHGLGFRIPPEYAGTSEDNFITRSLFRAEYDLKVIIGHYLNI